VYQIIQYIKFLRAATNQHGVHSPFVYNMVTKCFYDPKRHRAYLQLKAYRTALLQTKTCIDITDFGSGSKVFKSSKRSISKMAKTAGTSLKRAKLAYRLTGYFKPSETLELGTSLGIATHALALGHDNSKVTSIEGCPQTHTVAKRQLDSFQIKNVTLINDTFETSLPKLKAKRFDLVFIDGHHNGAATLHYFKELLSTAHNDSLFIFDDIYWSKDMTHAWERIKTHPKVSVTVDTFFWGFVFFRKEQAKEHFKIRV